MDPELEAAPASRQALIEDLLQVVRESLNGRTEQELRAVIHTVRGVTSGDVTLPMLRGPNGAVVAFVRPGAERMAVASDLYALGYALDDRWAPFFEDSGAGTPTGPGSAPN